MRDPQVYTRFLSLVVVFSCLLIGACGEKPMGPKEEQAIQVVKAYRPEGDFSVISNIDKRAEDSDRAGNKWQMGPWQAGFVSQKARIVDELSQYFNMFKATGARWVRFTYTDKDGAHEALWDTNIYTKKVEPKNELAKEFMTPPGT